MIRAVSAITRTICRGALPAALLVLLVLLALPAGADEVRQPADTSDAAVGLTEHLGTQLPLDLVFRDETGRPVRLGDLISGPTIILPVYYSCTNVCYNLQWGLARILPRIKNKPGTEYRVLSISFDESDSPQLAAKFKRVYLASMHAPFPEDAWRFLTGDGESIRLLTAAAGYGFQRKGRDFIHPTASLVVDGSGTIVRYLYGTTFLPKDISLALIEARDGTSGTTIRTVMEFCFTFDPQQKTYVFNLLRVSATVVILCTGGFLAYLFLSSTRTRRQSRK